MANNIPAQQDPWAVVSQTPAPAAQPTQPAQAAGSDQQDPWAVVSQTPAPEAGALSRFGSGVVAGTKAMIPTELPSLGEIATKGAIGPLYDIAQMPKAAYEGYKQAREEGQPIYSSVASGVGTLLGLDPEGIRERAAKGDVAGIIGEAVPSIALTLAGGEQERVGKAFQSDARALETAHATHQSASAVYDQRLREAHIAADQAVQATKDAEQAHADFKGGVLDQQRLNQANDRASAAAANARKATQALNDAHEQRATAAVEVDRLGRKVQNTATKVDAKQLKKTAQAKEDFQKAIPSPASGKAAYTDRDYEVGRGYLEHHHQNIEQVGSVQDTYDAFDHTQKSIEGQVAPYVQKYAKEPIGTNVKMDVRDALAENPRADFVEKGMQELENYNLTDPTIEEADIIRKQLNDENRGILKKNMWDVDTALGVDPAFAARYAAAESLRNGIYDTFEEKGVHGIREIRQDEASIIRLRNAAERQLTKGNVRVRGSGESGILAKTAGKLAGYAGTAVGAGIGVETGIPGAAEAGAIGGGLVGKKIGAMIAPGDLTRDALIERSMKHQGGGVPMTTIEGTGASAGPYKPPSPVSPLMQMYVPQRENSPLHADLATHYGESIDTSYVDLEKRFKDDIQSKRTHGVPLESDEKALLGKITQADAADRLAAQRQILDNQLKGKTQAGPTLPDEVEPLLHPPQSKLAEGMDTRSGIVHDLAHVVVGNERGIKFSDGIRSHLHPENVSAGSLMSAPIDWTPYMGEDGKIDPMKFKTKMADIAATYVAGGVANDLYHDIPFTENHHLGADVRILKGFMKDVGYTEAEASKMIAQAADDAKQVLARPGMRETLEGHAGVREAGLDKQYHVSPERMDQILQDVKGATSETTTGKPTGTAGAGEEVAGKPGAGAKAEPKEGDTAELRPERKGPTEREGGGVREVKPATEPEAEPKPAIKSEERRIENGRTIAEGSAGPGPESAPRPAAAEEPGSNIPAREIKPEPPKLGERQPLPEGSKFVEASPEEHRAELDKNRQAATLSDKTVEQLRDHKIFKLQTPEGGDTGIQYHITPEGEAGGFVNNGPYKNATPMILKHAAENGATHANAWDVKGALPNLYEKHGLKSVRSEPYDAATYGEPSEDLKSAWRAAGWKDGEPYPSVRHFEFPQNITPESPKLGPGEPNLDKWLEEKSGYHPDLQAVIKQTRSLHDNPAKLKESGSFITPDGRISSMRPGEQHPGIIAKATGVVGGPGGDNRPEFMQNTGAARTRFVSGRAGDTLSVSVPKTGITPDQLDTIRQGVGSVGRNGNLMIETAEEPSKVKSSYKEFATPRDVDSMLRQIGAHPDQRITPESPKLSPKGSSVPLMKKPLKIEGTAESGKANTLDVAKALNEYTKSKVGALELNEADDKQMTDRAKKLAEDEAKYQLNTANSGKAWYTTDIGIHDDVLKRMRPELADPAKLSLFKMSEAILSSGQKPYGNLKAAIRAWDHYNETGEFSQTNPATGKSWGPRGAAAYGNAMEMLNRLIKEKGEQGASDWLLSEHPVKELRQYNKLGVSGKNTDSALGAMILGEKRGPFAQNLHGIESAFTADMWVSRTWNRWMGTIEHDPATGEITTDAPRNKTERDLMRRSFEDTAKKLSEQRGEHISTSALQAILWYYEQSLYSAHGVPKESWSFADAAKRVEQEHAAAQPEAEKFEFGENVGKAESPEVENPPGQIHGLNFLKALGGK